MIYCVSDIHGELDKFEQMLELIRFSDEDHLYILGDVIDRGAMGVDILRRIMDAPNMTMLLGNHEQMCLSTLGPHNEFGARDLWRMNGGMPTYRELLYHRTPRERNAILRFLAGLPDHLDLEVRGQRFHLVHGYPGDDRDTRIWGRVELDSRSPYPDTICVVGHTPTVFLTGKHDEDFSIWHGDGILDIDCGCGSRKAVHRRLACLRLDDMAEFYVGGTGHAVPADTRTAPEAPGQALFHQFRSQAERRASGGSDFIEISYCKLPQGTPLREIVSVDAVEKWNNDSLYISGDDMDLFYRHYGGLITGGVYCNGNRGPMDFYGINFYSGDQARELAGRLKKEKPPSYQVLCDWLQAGAQSLGFYVLGV